MVTTTFGSQRVSTILLAVVLLLTMLAGGASAFDGKRKGFVIGLGGAFAPVVFANKMAIQWQREVYTSWDSTVVVYEPYFHRKSSYQMGAGYQFVIGYAPSEFDVIYYRGTQSFFDTDPWMSAGVSSICWSHYFGRIGRTFFSTMGVGLYNQAYWSNDPCVSENASLALVIGLGYEFRPHYSAFVNFNAGPAWGGWQNRSDLQVGIAVTAY